MEQARSARAINSETFTEPAEEGAISLKPEKAHDEASFSQSSGPEDSQLDILGTEVDSPTDCHPAFASHSSRG
jgi:hypothetical protein